jgi:hypothetical protein
MVYIEWALVVMTVVSVVLMVIVKYLLHMLQEHSTESTDTTAPVIGIPMANNVFDQDLHHDQNHRTSGERDTIHSSEIDIVQRLSAQIMRSLQNAGFYQEGFDRGFITLILKTSNQSDILPYIEQLDVNSVWVLIHYMSQLHLAKARNFKWSMCDGGPSSRPNVVIGRIPYFS